MFPRGESILLGTGPPRRGGSGQITVLAPRRVCALDRGPRLSFSPPPSQKNPPCQAPYCLSVPIQIVSFA